MGTALLLSWAPWSAAFAVEDASVIAQSADYFPDQIGNEWHYRGQITEGPLQTIELKFFSNVSSVTGTKTLKGMTVSVFHDPIQETMAHRIVSIAAIVSASSITARNRARPLRNSSCPIRSCDSP